jgi:hypothetical protein
MCAMPNRVPQYDRSHHALNFAQATGAKFAVGKDTHLRARPYSVVVAQRLHTDPQRAPDAPGHEGFFHLPHPA